MPRRELEELERWIEQHPILARTYTIGLAILVCELGLLLSELTRQVRP